MSNINFNGSSSKDINLFAKLDDMVFLVNTDWSISVLDSGIRIGSGTLFSNGSTTPRAPELVGEVLINGVRHSLSLWLRHGQNGDFYSGNIEAWISSGELPKNKPPVRCDDDAPF